MAGSSNLLLKSARIQEYYEYLDASKTKVSSFVSVKLSGSGNYLLWKAQMIRLLDSRNMCGLVDSAFAGPKDSGTGITRQYDSLARGWILGSVTEDVLTDVSNLGSAKAIWEKLKSIYDPNMFWQEVGLVKKMEWSILPIRFPDNLWDEIDKLTHLSYTQPQLYCQRLVMVEQLVKNTAEACSITAALITTIVFAAAFTIPGGSNQVKGTPLLENKKAFIFFVISDAISLFASSTALLVFLSILTARFAETGFLVSLPRRLFIGLFFLLLCVAAMMVALGATLFLFSCDQKPWMLVQICGLPFIPIAFLVGQQLPILVDLFTSTYLRIFGKQRKNQAVRDVTHSKDLGEVTMIGDSAEVVSMLKKEHELSTEPISSALHMAAETVDYPLLSASAKIQDTEYLYASDTNVTHSKNFEEVNIIGDSAEVISMLKKEHELSTEPISSALHMPAETVDYPLLSASAPIQDTEYLYASSERFNSITAQKSHKYLKPGDETSDPCSHGREESVKLSLSDELIRKACTLSMKAHRNQDYLISKQVGAAALSSTSAELLIVAFKGSMEVNGFYPDDHFGETNVDQKMFPSLQRIGEGQLAKVNRSFLQKFQNLLNNSSFKLEVEKAVKEDGKILFTGHSSGGAIASLATLWMLDEYTRKRKIRIPIGCVTFGSPLVGDGILTHTVRREKWAGHFTHFVMEHDIVPRMMLAPKTSIQEHLSDILQFFQQKVNPLTTQKPHKFPKFFNKKTPVRTIDHDSLVDDNPAVTFFENVLINASTVASHDAFDLMEPSNSLKDKLSVKVSPYRPFGTYVFCTRGDDDLGSSSPRQQLVVENPNAVLQLLFYFLQLPNEDQDLAKFAHESLNTNFRYEEELNNNGLHLEKRVDLKHLYEHLLTFDGTTGDTVRTSNKALFELTASAKWCLQAVEEAEKRKLKNLDQIKKSMRKYKSNARESTTKIIEDMLDEMHKYKEKARHGTVDYYEAFKLQAEHDDFKANVNRLEQAKIWDVIVEMVVRKDLPDDFEVRDEWVDLGTRFRRICEPLDIANYYRHSKGDDKGSSYMEVRPKRYKFLQRWYEHANVMGFELLSESNFVAEVEELMKRKKKTVEEARKDFENIKDKVQMWKSDEKIAYEDVFWGESVLSKLQGKLTKAA